MGARSADPAGQQGERHEKGGEAGNHGELAIARHYEWIHHWQEGEKQEDDQGLADFSVDTAGDTIQGDKNEPPILRDAAKQNDTANYEELTEDLLELEAIEHY